MRITRIVLTDFRRHDRLDIRPAPCLTIVRGPNEAGKSTLQEALRLALFRKADTGREDVRTLARWGASDPPEVLVEFEADGRSGRLVKRFGGQKGEGELTLDGQTIRDFALIRDEVAAITGIPSEAFFRATACVGHAELADVDPDDPALSDRLQKVVSGADRGTAQAKKKLDAAIHRYRTEGHKNPGLLKVASEEIARLEADLAAGERDLARLEADRANWAEAHARREDLDIELARQGADLADAVSGEQLVAQRDEHQRRYERLKLATELVSEADTLDRETPTLVPLVTLRDGVRRADVLRYELSELEAELDVDVEAGVAGAPGPGASQPVRWLVLSALLLAGAWLAWALLGGALGGIGLVVLVALSLVALVRSVRLTMRRRQQALAGHLAQDAAARRLEIWREQEERFRLRRRELDALLGELGVPDVEAAEELLASAERNTERLARIEGELRGLGVEDRNAHRLEEARDEAAAATEQAAHALAGMGLGSADAAAARQAAQRLVAQTEPARDAARTEEDQAQGRVDANLVDAEVVAGLAERLGESLAHHAELLRRVGIYEGTRRAIEAAEQVTLKTAARYLEEHMGPVVARITAGRYSEVRVDETTLTFRVRAPETGELLDVRQLSRGTADQLFLAARLGLVRLVTMERRPPIILDDPFVTFDADRAERALRLLKEVAGEAGFQVFLLTCSERHDALADELVVLAGPAVETVEAGPPLSPAR